MTSVSSYKRLEEIRAELSAILAMEESKHVMDSCFAMVTCLEEVIERLDAYLDYDPTDDMMGEPPITAAEMHATAWRQHTEMHR